MSPRAAKLSPVENPLSICDLSLKKVLKLTHACQESLEKTCSKGENVTFSQSAVAAAYAPQTSGRTPLWNRCLLVGKIS